MVEPIVEPAHRWSEFWTKTTSCLCAILASSASSVRGKDCTHMLATPILSGKLGVCCSALPKAAMAFSVACPLVSSLQQTNEHRLNVSDCGLSRSSPRDKGYIHPYCSLHVICACVRSPAKSMKGYKLEEQ